jgi:hypothetical protein
MGTTVVIRTVARLMPKLLICGQVSVTWWAASMRLLPKPRRCWNHPSLPPPYGPRSLSLVPTTRRQQGTHNQRHLHLTAAGLGHAFSRYSHHPQSRLCLQGWPWRVVTQPRAPPSWLLDGGGRWQGQGRCGPSATPSETFSYTASHQCAERFERGFWRKDEALWREQIIISGVLHLV